MTRPTTQIEHVRYQHPGARLPLIVPVLVICNTPDEELERNVRANSARDLEWIKEEKPHDGVAVVVGGGPSLAESIEEIESLGGAGGVVFAMNGASQFLNGLTDYQVIGDAKPETNALVDTHAPWHLFASQVNPNLLADADMNIRLWHLALENMETWFPPERVKRGGYVMVGGGAAVGNSALCLVYAMGYRAIHIFGFDSSHRDTASHAYPQPMNAFIPTTEVEWAGRKFTTSLAMKAQAEKFQLTGQALVQAGVTLHVHGDGLLPTMWNTPLSEIGEREKYQTLWQLDEYRRVSPGEHLVEEFFERTGAGGGDLVLDIGCGTGRAALKISERGNPVLLIDFADNCRDEEAMVLPFLHWDLKLPLPPSAKCALCADVMEHIPADDVQTVVKNIMDAAETVFFQISTIPDGYGALVGATLHHSVHPPEWWLDLFREMGYRVDWSEADETAMRMVVRRD